MYKGVDIEPEYLESLKELLRRHVPNAEVWAYGSRVSGGGHDSSDLDIVLRNPDDLNKPQENLIELRDALSESDIPTLVDALDWARIPESFRANIEKRYEVVQKAGGG